MTGSYDATITKGADPALRLSNAVVSGSFGDELFSPTLDVAATENGPAPNVYRVLLSSRFDSAGPAVTASPDNGQGGRGGFLAIQHTATASTWSARGCISTGRANSIGTVKHGGHRVDPSQPQTAKLKLVEKPDTKKSTNNDVFSVQVDGKPVKNTTFEAYYQATKEQNYQTDTLMFRLSATPQMQPSAAGPADRRRRHRDLLTSAQHLPKRGGPTPSVGPPLCRAPWLRGTRTTPSLTARSGSRTSASPMRVRLRLVAPSLNGLSRGTSSGRAPGRTRRPTPPR